MFVPAGHRTRAARLKQKKIISTTLALKVHICVLSLEARRCHISQIQEPFSRNRSVERQCVIGYFRLICS
jgi:hypothetical protein